MFTGIVQSRGEVVRVAPVPAGLRLWLRPLSREPLPGGEGDSFSVSGCCLTLVPPDPDAPDGLMHFDIVGETLARTTLARLRPGDLVNLEPSCRADSLLAGHIVQGHIDGVGRVARVRADPADWRVAVEAPADLLPCIVPKGSVALDGVSLTVASVEGAVFEVALIPATLERTTLAALRAGDAVNIESDILARTVVHALRAMGAARA